MTDNINGYRTLVWDEISRVIKSLEGRKYSTPSELRSYVVNEQVERERNDLKALRLKLWKAAGGL